MRFWRRDTEGSFVPPAGRLTIPVLAPTGGAGRSTLAYLLAAGVAEHARTVVVDTAARLASPWAVWVTRPAGDEGAAETVRTLGPGAPVASSIGSPLSAQQVYAAAGSVATGTGSDFAALQTAGRTASVMVDLFAPRIAVIDTDPPVLAALSDDPSAADDLLGGLGEWLTSPECAPLLCAPASAKGITDLSLAVHGLRDRGVRTERMHVAVVGVAAPELPRRVRAGLTLLQPYVAGTAWVPHEPRLHAVGTPSWARSTLRLRASVHQLLRALITSAAADVEPASPSLRARTPTTGGTDALARPR